MWLDSKFPPKTAQIGWIHGFFGDIFRHHLFFCWLTRDHITRSIERLADPCEAIQVTMAGPQFNTYVGRNSIISLVPSFLPLFLPFSFPSLFTLVRLSSVRVCQGKLDTPLWISG